MYPRGRPVVPDFDPTERLFLRYQLTHWVVGQLAPTGIRFNGKSGVSVNRSQFGLPEDTLFHEEGRYNGLGVVQFLVADIPLRVDPDSDKGESGEPYRFRLKHVPLDVEADPTEVEINYAHSEIWSHRADSTEVDPAHRDPGKTIQVSFKIRLCQRIRQEQICIEAAL